MNGTPLESAQPVVAGDRMLVPFVAIMRALAVSVAREGKSIVASAPTKVIRVTIGSRQAKINNSSVDMGAAAIEQQGTTFVPLRFITDAIGAEASVNRLGGRIEIV